MNASRHRSLWVWVLLGAGCLRAATPPYETAEGYLVLPPGRVGVRHMAVPLPDKLRETPVMLLDGHGVRWPFTLLDSGDEIHLLFDARVNESFRLLYGFEEPVEGFVPVTRADNPRMLEGRVRVEPLRDQSMKQTRALQEVRRPLARLGVLLGVGICLFAGLGVWYRRAVG